MVDLLTTDRVFLRVHEVQALFGVSRRTVYNWAARRKIAYVHIAHTLRFPVAELRHLIVHPRGHRTHKTRQGVHPVPHLLRRSG
jgi:predicted DNA-binding transcriptional regulator AlpA